MKKALVFPGQGAQFVGMGKELNDNHEEAKALFTKANEILGFELSDLMFDGTEEALKDTKVTQPALFTHSVVRFLIEKDKLEFNAVAGHSLGEFSALVAAGVLSFEDGLKLVQKRAQAMQKACELVDGTMAAVLGLDDEIVEDCCEGIDEIVVAANYNCPGQLVISGSEAGIDQAIEVLKEKGARRALKLNVGGAFHSPLMEVAREELESAIKETNFKEAVVPVYQNVDGKAYTNAEEIKKNLIAQLTSPVKWTQIMTAMKEDGFTDFVEIGGNGKVIKGLLRRLDRTLNVEALI